MQVTWRAPPSRLDQFKSSTDSSSGKEVFMNRIIRVSSRLSTQLLPSMIPDSLTQISETGLSMLKTTEEADASRTVVELIESRGFEAEEYDLPTEDGFILKLHRIVNPFVSRITDFDSKPILLGHGIAAHAGHWLINSEDGHLDPSFLHEVLNQEARTVRQQNKEQLYPKPDLLVNDNNREQQQDQPDYSEKENNNNLRNYLSNGINGLFNVTKSTSQRISKNCNNRSQSVYSSKTNKHSVTQPELNRRRINSRASFSFHNHERKRSSLPYKVPEGLLGNKPDLKASNNLGFLLANLG